VERRGRVLPGHDGIDTFIFADDGIRVQTVRYTLESA